MKSFLLTVCLFTGMSLFAQADIQFKESKHSFGKIKKGVPATYIFTFTNKANKPVVIEFANAECGCTTPVYPKTPIVKGQTGTIKVTYNAATPGTFKKNVDVKFAHSNQPYTLTIDGEVVEPKIK
ncbi:MAG TPA: DUF1573 domain-containing protein [Sediminibacterium sp.]|nr:DUF1573 domain-containing protein [Sediminibacterium sp.]